MAKMIQISETELAALRAQATAVSDRPVVAEPRSGVSKKNGKPYKGFRVTGPFAPVYLSEAQFRGIVGAAGDLAKLLS
jgi:hypothetical protein